jgi:hypothetical protein
MSPRIPISVWVFGIGLFGCDKDEEKGEPDDGITLLSPRAQLIRLSVDLRGRHPTEAELVSIDPDSVDEAGEPGDERLYEDYVDAWLEEPEFVDRAMEVFNFRYLTRTGEDYYDDWDNVGLQDYTPEVVAEAVGEEPLRLLGYIVDNDLPYSEIVLADYTMANDLVRQAWRLEYLEDEPGSPTMGGWRKAAYTDGRPMNGILTMQTIWEKYPSMGDNANRHRANAVSKMLLCDDYLSRPIVLNRAAIDQLTIDPELAIATEGCQSCHSTLDPLAAHFFGWFRYDDPDGVIDGTTYWPDYEMEWVHYSGKSPGYYGTPTANMQELAESLAVDERFMKCAVETMFTGITQRVVEDEDWPELQTHLDVFQQTDMSIKETVRSIVMTREYLAAAVEDEEKAERIATVKLVSPAQLADIVYGATGYKWEFGGRETLKNNDMGMQVLAGGIDSAFVTTTTYKPTLGLVEVQKRLAESAAYSIAAHDLDPARDPAADPARLLKYVTIDSTPEADGEAFEAQIRDLYLQITGLPLAEDATEPAELTAMWKEVYSVEGDEMMAWTALVAAVLRDPAVILY